DYATALVEEIAKWVRYFYVTLRKSDGSFYSPNTIVGIRAALFRYFMKLPGLNIIAHEAFHSANLMVKNVCNAYLKSGGRVQHYEAIESDDLVKLASYFDRSNPTRLQEEVYFNVLFYFGNRGREWLRGLTVRSFREKALSNGAMAIELQGSTSKNVKGSSDMRLCDDNKQALMVAKPETRHCPVQAFQLYLSSWKCTKHLLHLLRQLRFNECSTYGNSKRSRLLGLKDHRGRTASDLARLNDHSELANYIELEMRLVFHYNGSITGLDFVESWLKDMKKLIEDENYSALVQKVNRINCDLPNSQGNTFLLMFMHVAQPQQRSNPDTTNLNQETFLKKLLQVCDPTCANTYGMSALHIAAYKGNSAAAIALLNAGATANVYMCLEWTPLMQAAFCTQQDAAASVCWILLCAGSNWSLKNREGKTALDLATEQGSHKMAELLRSFRENDAWTTRPQYQTGSGESGASYSYEYRSPPAAYMRQASQCTPQSLQAVDQHSAVESDCSSNSSRSDECYPVTNPQGFCVIINISKFESSSEGERKGSQFDVERVSELFSKLGFIIDVREDLTADEIENYLDCVRIWKELERHGAFVCFLMTHGREDCIVGSDGKPCKIFDLTRKFQPKLCSSLAGKPKIFFIQACRGLEKDELLVKRETIDNAGGRFEGTSVVYPSNSDFLIFYATPRGQVAFRDENTGSYFIQTVCELIEKYYQTEDLMSIMVRVNKRMAKKPYRDGDQYFHVVGEITGHPTRKISLDPSRACD
uniref:ANK_REP_REGION domain-containing protein n=1 Tax=Macrostomum lignano TaxID=282301 RepID=A0A1I8GLR6_9PLAT